MDSMTGKDILFFGPWVGEFGYELIYWIGECRTIRNKHKDMRAVASSFYGRKRLYDDFVDEFIPHTPDSLENCNSSMCEGRADLDDEVKSYMTNPRVFMLRPAMEYNGFTLGGHVFPIRERAQKRTRKGPLFFERWPEKMERAPNISMSAIFQTPHKLLPSQEALEIAKELMPSEKIISIFCRKHYFSNCAWREDNWKNLVTKLVEKGYGVVSLSPYYAAKPSALSGFCPEGMFNLGDKFRNTENFVDLQLAFLHLSEMAICTPSGCTHMVRQTGTPILYMVEKEERLWLMNFFKKTTYSPILSLIGDGNINDISVEDCLEGVETVGKRGGEQKA